MCCCFFSFCSPESSTPSPFSLQPMPSLMPSSSLQPPPLLVPSASLQSLTSPPSCSPSTPLSEVESPPLPSASLQLPPWMMPPSSLMQQSSESLPSYSFSTPFPAVEDKMMNNSQKNEEGNSMSCKKKERIVWTEELHQKFVWAVEQLGGPHKSVPKRILEIMNNSELKPSHISSHLQKYRKCLEGIKGALKTDLEKIRSPYVVHEQYPVMNDINMYMKPSEMNYSNAAVEQRAKCHQLHHPNPYMESNMLMPSLFSQQPSSSLQPPPSLMPWSSLHSPPLLQPPPLLVPSVSLPLLPSYFLSSSPLSTVEESDMLTPSPFLPQPSSSPQPPPSLMQWSSMHSPPLLQPPPLLVPSTSLPSPPSYSLSSSPLSTVEENDMLMPSPFSPQPPSSLQPPPSPMQWSSLQSPPLLQAPPLLVSSVALQPPPLIMPSSSQSLPPSYSLSTPLPTLEDTNEKGNSMPHKRKERIIWTEELHQKFVCAVEQLGGLDNAVSKQILQIMNNPKLNPKHISSHLQKYRKRLEGIKGAPKIATQAIGSPSVVHEQYPEMNDINMYMTPSEMNYSAAAVEQRANSHQQLHPNPSMMSDEPLELFWADSSLNYDDIFSDF